MSDISINDLKNIVGNQNKIIKYLESQLDKYKKACEVLRESNDKYANGSSHHDAKYEWGNTHDPEIGTETVPSGQCARQAEKQVKEILK